jgi:hypothetical protein
MGFWDLFLPITAALIVAGITLEMFRFLLGMGYELYQQKRVEEQMAKMIKAGVHPSEFMGGALGETGPDFSNINPKEHVTCSGGVVEGGHGTYL